MTRFCIISCAALMALGACTEKSAKVVFDGKYYPAKATSADKENRHEFEVNVRRAAQGIEGAREAGRHAGVRYCIENFGTSRIEWAQGPDVESGDMVLDNGNLYLRGSCVTW